MTSAVFDHRHRVAEEEIDAQGHVHNLRYLQWSLWAAGSHSSAVGWDAQRLLAQFRAGWVVRSHEITYKAAATQNQRIVVRTWITERAKYTATRRSCIYRLDDRKMLARVSTRWAMIDMQLRTAVPIPSAVWDSIPPIDGPVASPWES